MKNSAFSLIELLVVVAIIGVIAAIAVPAYSNYQIKAKIADSIIIINKIVSDLETNYSRTGTFPPSITINGFSAPSGAWSNIDGSGNNPIGNLKAMAYVISGDGKGVELAFVVKGLTGVPTYVEPLAGAIVPATGKAQGMAVGLRDLNGTLKYACGQADPSFVADYLPLGYLPMGCQCTNIGGTGGFILNGTAC